MSYTQKKFLHKVYDSAGDYVTTWSIDVSNDPSFRKIIFGGCGEMIINLSRKADEFGEEQDVKFRNQIKTYIFDVDNPTGKLIFNGYISGYEPVLNENTEYVKVHVLSYATDLKDTVLSDVAGNTTISYPSYDPSDIIRDIIDKYQAKVGASAKIDYDAATIESVGTYVPGYVVSYEFNSQNVWDAINIACQSAPSGWYWYIDENNMLNFHPKSVTADHIFTVGKDVKMIESFKRIENIKNVIYYTGGDPGGGVLYKYYDRPGSIAAYGLHEEQKQDERITVLATMDYFADAFLDNNDSPEVRTIINIVDNNGVNNELGFDIESVKIGDTCQILNFASNKIYTLWDVAEWDVDKWDYSIVNVTATVMQIQSIEYNYDYIVMELSTRLPYITKRIEDIERNLANYRQLVNPAAPL